MPSRTARLRPRAISLLPLGLLAACLTGTDAGSPSNPATDTYAASLGVNIAQMTKISDALYIQDLVTGTGATAASGRFISVNYTGWLTDGTQFGTSVGGTPLSFTLGTGDVIKGWDLGILAMSMKVGGKRRLVIGSDLAYGSGGNGIIRPNSTIVFDVQLLSVQ
jgi:FKBP-type peptidyl-prolyl cis-trans isomerase FkpA